MVRSEKVEDYAKDNDGQKERVCCHTGPQLTKRICQTALESPLVVVGYDKEMQHKVEVNFVDDTTNDDADQRPYKDITNKMDTLVDPAIAVGQSP